MEQLQRWQRAATRPCKGDAASKKVYMESQMFGIIFCDPETVLVPPTITRIPGWFKRTGTDVAVVIRVS